MCKTNGAATCYVNRCRPEAQATNTSSFYVVSMRGKTYERVSIFIFFFFFFYSKLFVFFICVMTCNFMFRFCFQVFLMKNDFVGCVLQTHIRVTMCCCCVFFFFFFLTSMIIFHMLFFLFGLYDRYRFVLYYCDFRNLTS